MPLEVVAAERRQHVRARSATSRLYEVFPNRAEWNGRQSLQTLQFSCNNYGTKLLFDNFQV